MVERWRGRWRAIEHDGIAGGEKGREEWGQRMQHAAFCRIALGLGRVRAKAAATTACMGGVVHVGCGVRAKPFHGAAPPPAEQRGGRAGEAEHQRWARLAMSVGKRETTSPGAHPHFREMVGVLRLTAKAPVREATYR